MKTVGREISAAIVVLVVLQVLTSVAGAWLLGRMSPAVSHILDRNERSLEALESMAFALADDASLDRRRARFEAALGVAEGNITEEGERAPLATIDTAYAAALEGDPEALGDVLGALQTLGEVNRAAMHAADREARRLGLAGAWVVALLGLLGLGASIYTAQRVKRQFVLPLALLADVVDEHARGASHRRCPKIERGELVDVLAHVNGLLDRLERAPGRGEGPALERALHRLLDARGTVVLFDGDGKVLGASASALDRLAAEPTLRAKLTSAARGELDPALGTVEPLGEGAWLATLS
jgi:hypothetical protein